jgi:hypothetical protein
VEGRPENLEALGVAARVLDEKAKEYVFKSNGNLYIRVRVYSGAEGIVRLLTKIFNGSIHSRSSSSGRRYWVWDVSKREHLAEMLDQLSDVWDESKLSSKFPLTYPYIDALRNKKGQP